MDEYVEDAYVAMVRNDNYWGVATIDGKEYQAPFIDRLVQPIIVDPSTQLAALRTGKADIHTSVKMMYENSMDQTNPDMLKYKYMLANCRLISMKQTDHPYFQNENIRRAMMIGTDLQGINDAVFLEGEIHGFPLNSATPYIFTPLEELPESTALLFDYNPDLAKQMLADEGYPDGFSVELVIRSDPEFQDMGAMIAANWADIGVETSLITMDTALHDLIRTSHNYKDTFLWETGSSSIPGHIGVGAGWNDIERSSYKTYDSAEYRDIDFNTKYYEAYDNMDSQVMKDLSKELCIELIDTAAYIPLANPYQICYTWPWVKNYYGEVETGFINYAPMWNTMWVDQDLKDEMGY